MKLFVARADLSGIPRERAHQNWNKWHRMDRIECVRVARVVAEATIPGKPIREVINRIMIESGLDLNSAIGLLGERNKLKDLVKDLRLRPKKALTRREHEHELRLLSMRGRPKPEFGQGFCDAGTLERRVIKMMNDLPPRCCVLFLGDDDMTSPLLSVCTDWKLTVVHIDEELLARIRRFCTDAGSSVETVKVDLRKGIPESLIDKYDAFFCDPPGTSSGVMLFVSQGALALSKEAGRGYVNIPTSHLGKRYLKVQKLANRAGMAIREIIPAFNRYDLTEEEIERYADTEGLSPKVRTILMNSAQSFSDLLVLQKMKDHILRNPQPSHFFGRRLNIFDYYE